MGWQRQHSSEVGKRMSSSYNFKFSDLALTTFPLTTVGTVQLCCMDELEPAAPRQTNSQVSHNDFLNTRKP